MSHRIEVSPSGRATCKSCGKSIAKGELRLGEAYESQFGSDGFAIRWHHLACGAAKLPDALQEAMEGYDGEIPGRVELEAVMSAPPATKKASKMATGALPSADLAPTGRAKCIQCAAAIAKGSVRVVVEREVDTGTFVTKGPGYLHPGCAEAWAEGSWDEGIDDLIEQVNTNTGLDVLPAPFASAEGTEQQKTNTPKSAKADSHAEVPALGALSGKQVAALAQKLSKLKEDYKADSIFDKANIEWGARDPLRWHLAQHGLLSPCHPTLLSRLSDSAHAASADAVFSVLPKIAPAKSWTELAPGWPSPADAIAVRAHALDPARLEALLDSVPRAVRTGIQLVRGRHGATLSSEDRSAVLAGLAYAEAGHYGIGRISGSSGERLAIKTIGADGKTSEPYLEAFDLARHFCDGVEAWESALADACRAGRFQGIGRVLPGLARLPLADLVALLSKTYTSSDHLHDRRMAELLARRGDSPQALIEAARSITGDQAPGKYLREDLYMHGLAKMQTGIPEGIEGELSWDAMHFTVSPWRDFDVKRAAYRAALMALGRERSLAMARKCLDRNYNRSQALTYLTVHWDEAMCREVLTVLEDHGDPAAMAALGPQVLPSLLEAMAVEPPKGSTKDKRMAILRRGIQGVLAVEGREGRGCDEKYDAYVSCETHESYWQEDGKKQLPLALLSMSDARRQATLDRLFAETKQPERPFSGVGVVESAAYREKAARILVQRYGQVSDATTLQIGLKALPAGSLSSFRAALLEEKPDPKLFQQLQYVFGDKEVGVLMKEGGVKEEKPLDRLRRLAGEQIAAGALKTRVYLLERPDHGTRDGAIPSPRAGSFSRARGKGPVFDHGGLGEREHILTLDLTEVPELASAGVRALSLYASDPDHGDSWDAAELVSVPEGAGAPTDGHPVTVLPLEVPVDVFDSTPDTPVMKEIRSLLFNRPGYALGEPMFIQEEGGGGQFVMQLAERIADLNLGDSGSLYVFEDAVFMQCY